MLHINRSRPLGVTIIAVLMAIYGFLSIISGITLMSASSTLAMITVALAILELVLAWGLWNLQKWAYWATVVLEILALIDGIVAFTQGGASSGMLSIVLALILLIYLFADPNVRLAFRT